MKLKFKAKGIPQPDYVIVGDTINGLDLSEFPEGGMFVGDQSTEDAGIHHVERVGGELVATLGQRGIAYEAPARSSDWKGDPELLIDAEDYDPDTCYIVATAKPEGAEYVKRAEGWTVAIPEPEENEQEEDAE